jgi:lysophospholipase L1-like esterase
MTTLVDSVLLSGAPALRAARPCWRVYTRGRPALMIRVAEREIAARHRRVSKLVVIGLGYNSLWERHRRHHARWAGRFDRDARRLLRTLRRLGARQFVWVTLREPTRKTVPPSGWRELGLYSWYFPYVNERLHRLDRRRSDLVLADWAAVSRRRGLTYDSIHLNPRGARLMAKTIRAAVFKEAARQARRPAQRR